MCGFFLGCKASARSSDEEAEQTDDVWGEGSPVGLCLLGQQGCTDVELQDAVFEGVKVSRQWQFQHDKAQPKAGASRKWVMA